MPFKVNELVAFFLKTDQSIFQIVHSERMKLKSLFIALKKERLSC